MIPACWIHLLSQLLAAPKQANLQLWDPSFSLPFSSKYRQIWCALALADQFCLKILSPDKLLLTWSSLHRSLLKCSFTGRETLYKMWSLLCGQSWQVSGTDKNARKGFSIFSIKEFFYMQIFYHLSYFMRRCN